MSKNFEDSIVTKITLQLASTLQELGLGGEAIVQKVTSKVTYGDFCTPVFKLAKINKRNPIELANEIAKGFSKSEILDEIFAEGGFVNYKLNRKYWSECILKEILDDKLFFYNDSLKGFQIMVEHTSANPNSPIHIGNFRGSIIGDTFARLLKANGASVKTHFYVDDLGHQIPILVIGCEQLKKYKKFKPDIKIDHYIGRIYAITHTIYDIQKLKQELEKKYDIIIGKSHYWLEKEENDFFSSNVVKQKIPIGDYQEYLTQFNFIFSVQSNIYKRHSKLYETIKECLERDKIDLPSSVPELNRRYYEQDNDVVKIVRATCEDVLTGQKEELAFFGITHDHFDWEADLEWSGKVVEVLTQLENNKFIIHEGKAKIFDANKAAELVGAREYLNLKQTYEVPKALLITSAGDSLYLLRDIAYSIEKIDCFKNDKVYNVIGKEQELTQRQLNLAIRATGRKDVADKIRHLNYEMMELKGALTHMSARRLQYITPIELLTKTKEAVMESFLKERDYPKHEKEEIAKIVAIGAIKYSIIAIGLMKKLLFDPQEVISLTNNTSPFIQYAFARSQNILVKTNFIWMKEKSNVLKELVEDEEWLLILLLAKFPNIVENSASQIKPELICNYLFELANLFNKFYDSYRVLDASTQSLIEARLALTFITGYVLSSGLQLLGIESPKRM